MRNRKRHGKRRANKGTPRAHETRYENGKRVDLLSRAVENPERYGLAMFSASHTPPPGTFSNRFDGLADRQRSALAAMAVRALLEGPKADA